MYKIKYTPEFDKWLKGTKNAIFIKQLYSRFKNIEQGNFGLHKRLNEHLFELKFTTGAGYRVYYLVADDVIILLGGVKKTQSKDIKKAMQILKQYILKQ